MTTTLVADDATTGTEKDEGRANAMVTERDLRTGEEIAAEMLIETTGGATTHATRHATAETVRMLGADVTRAMLEARP